MSAQPLYPGVFADPFVLRRGNQYFAYGTGYRGDDGVFEVLRSPDLRHWIRAGAALVPLDAGVGDEYWAPEVAFADGAYWMYYSVGHGIQGHHIRVARSDSATGPFEDLGRNLTPGETFAIDPHPFLDDDGRWYLFYARDVLTSDRVGTHLAVAPMVSMTELEPSSVVLEPNDDWQIYERDRAMYDSVYDWHTLEGPAVIRRLDRYWLTYSGGAWTGPGYGVAWAYAPSPLGPWEHGEGARILSSTPEQLGPGHSSLTMVDGGDAIVYHAWDPAMTGRRMFANRITFTDGGPQLGGAILGGEG